MTKIEWCDETVNCLIGCSPVSEACVNCYAARMATRLAGNPATPQYHPIHKDSHHPVYDERVADGGKWTGVTRWVPEQMEKVLRWQKPRRIFWNSMGDTFHPGNSNEHIAAMFGVMAATPQHTHLLLTKRIERTLEWFERIDTDRQEMSCGPDATAEESDWCRAQNTRQRRCMEAAIDALGLGIGGGLEPWPLPNVMIGTTVEDQQRADERVPVLLQVPAVKRFVSLEPLLGEIDLTNAAGCTYWDDPSAGISWCIVGAETGPGKRPMDLDWARRIRDVCIEANIPFFFKRDSDGNRELDGKIWSQLP